MIVAQRTGNLRKTKSLEAILLTCVQTRLWSRAAALMDMIEETSPGYFTSVSSYTNLWPWERCLYAGLVMESGSSHQEANLYFSQARGFLLSWASVLADDDYRLLLNKAEVNRLMGAGFICELLLAQAGVKQLGPSSNPAIDRECFEKFPEQFQWKDAKEHYISALRYLEATRPHYLWSEAVIGITPEQTEAQKKWELLKELRNKTLKAKEEKVELDELEPLEEKYFRKFRETSRAQRKSLPLTNLPVAYFIESIPDDALVLHYFTTQDGTILVALDKVMASVVPFPLTDALGRLEVR